MKRRVVVTGVGVISPLGNDINIFIENIKKAKNGIKKIESFDTTNHKVKLAAEICDFDPKKFSINNAKKKDKFVQYAIAAAKQVKENSQYRIDESNEFRTGVIIGSGIGGLETISEETKKYIEKGPKKVSSHFIPKSISNMASGSVSIELGTKGVCFSTVTACATGTDSIGQAYRLIKDGYQDAIFAGGSEASICQMGIGGFEAMSALSVSEDVQRASIPFDKERSGFVMGEGSGILLLESLESAIKRNANIICEIVGYGQTSDSHHITAPDPTANSAYIAMKLACEDADIKAEDLSYINAHGTSTKLNDNIETLAIKKLYKNQIENIAPISSTKSMTGHMLGAAGAIEAIVCAFSVKEDFIAPTINYRVKDELCDLDYVTDGTRYTKVDYAMSNSLGFGGHNSSIIMKKYIK